MRNVTFLVKFFLVWVMMLACFDGYSQSLLSSIPSRKSGGGTGQCSNCTKREIYDITFTIRPTHFPFKVEEVVFTDIKGQGYNISFGGSDTHIISNPEIINPITNTIVPNQVIYSNSPLLDIQSTVSVRVRITPVFCADPSLHPLLIKFRLNSEINITNYGEASLNSDASVILSQIIPLQNPCQAFPINPFPSKKFLPSKIQSSVQPGKFVNPSKKGVKNNQISIYPNPFQDKVEVQLNLSKNEVLNIKVFNQIGQEIEINSFSKSFPKSVSPLIINFEKFPNGIYYIHLSSTLRDQVFKMLKTGN